MPTELSSLDFWRNITKKLNFYTVGDKDRIPEAHGCYAWYLPLWLYDEDPESFIGLVGDLFDYDARTEGPAIAESTVRYNWSDTNITLQSGRHRGVSDDKRSRWNELLAGEESARQLKGLLMQSSLFMPPLYVGKSTNLRSRYLQHIRGTDGRKNDFHHRFTTYASELNFSLGVSDLVFACIETDPINLGSVAPAELNDVLEYFLIRLSRPPFGRA